MSAEFVIEKWVDRKFEGVKRWELCELLLIMFTSHGIGEDDIINKLLNTMALIWSLYLSPNKCL